MTRYAVMLNIETDEIGRMANGLKYAIELDDHGHEVEVYLDGTTTAWPGVLQENPSHVIHKYFDVLQERDLIKGACGYCAYVFDGVEGCRAAGIELIGDEENHGPNVGALVDKGYELLTIG